MILSTVIQTQYGCKLTWPNALRAYEQMQHETLAKDVLRQPRN